jgi:hypothetical protein
VLPERDLRSAKYVRELFRREDEASAFPACLYALPGAAFWMTWLYLAAWVRRDLHAPLAALGAGFPLLILAGLALGSVLAVLLLTRVALGTKLVLLAVNLSPLLLFVA